MYIGQMLHITMYLLHLNADKQLLSYNMQGDTNTNNTNTTELVWRHLQSSAKGASQLKIEENK